MSSNPDPYFLRTEVSNSDLTALKDILHPVQMPQGARQAAFRFGSLFDAIVTEPQRVNFYQLSVDGEPYPEADFALAQEMLRSLRATARRDPFLAKVLLCADTQRVMVNKAQPFDYAGFPFSLDTRCKWDWWLPAAGFGGDLKTCSCQTQSEFLDSVDFFDWDRSRSWYMDIAGSGRDFIYAVSKRNCNVFTLRIQRGDALYQRGRQKYEELAFQYWCLSL